MAQGGVDVASAAVEAREVGGSGPGRLSGKGVDGRRVVGQLGLGVGPLAGEFGAELE